MSLKVDLYLVFCLSVQVPPEQNAEDKVDYASLDVSLLWKIR